MFCELKKCHLERLPRSFLKSAYTFFEFFWRNFNAREMVRPPKVEIYINGKDRVGRFFKTS